MNAHVPGGMFIWYELMTTDSAAALKFYADVLGWTGKDAGTPGISYTIVSAGPDGVGGILALPPEGCGAASAPAWSGYIGVANVDAHVAQVESAGGTILRAPADIPGVGRFAVVADPHGASFILMTPVSPEPLPEVAPGTPGHVGWRELHAGNGAEAFTFYSGLFGWTRADAMDMGAMGVYQLFSTGNGPVGGMMTRMPDSPRPFWLYYWNVEALDSAVARVAASGGRLLLEPHEVPGGSWIAQCADPQGALFAMVAPRR